MPDDDRVVANEDVLDDETHDSLALHDLKRVRGAAQTAEDCVFRPKVTVFPKERERDSDDVERGFRRKVNGLAGMSEGRSRSSTSRSRSSELKVRCVAIRRTGWLPSLPFAQGDRGAGPADCHATDSRSSQTQRRVRSLVLADCPLARDSKGSVKNYLGTAEAAGLTHQEAAGLDDAVLWRGCTRSVTSARSSPSPTSPSSIGSSSARA